MSKQYGALELSMQTLTIIAIIAVITLAVAFALYALGTIVAFAPHLIGFSLVTVLVASAWTDETAWDQGGVATFILAIVAMAVAGFGPLCGDGDS